MNNTIRSAIELTLSSWIESNMVDYIPSNDYGTVIGKNELSRDSILKQIENIS